MRAISVRTLEEWREHARKLLAHGVPPHEIVWGSAHEPLLFQPPPLPALPPSPTRVVPRRFMELARYVSCHRSHRRWDLLYRVLWRLTHGEPAALDRATDPEIFELLSMVRAVKRDIHKTHAFVRFVRVVLDEEERYVAYHEPQHHTLRLSVPFFTRRFASMKWSILTPEETAHWDGDSLSFGAGVPERTVLEDDLEQLWIEYYRSTFNPARVNLRMTVAEMPVHHWATLPEARIIPELVKDARARASKMVATSPKLDELPRFGSLDELQHELNGCTRCPLYANATQAVPGRGNVQAALMFVGEQPGDEEDIRGEPFVGPAGRLLDQAFTEAGIERTQVYLTNAVKHFKWVPRGKRRIHQKPSGTEINTCRGWLSRELELVRPRVVVCLGVSAAQAVLGRTISLSKERGRILTGNLPMIVATLHPAAVLRIPEEEARDDAFSSLVRDLRFAHELSDSGA